MKLYVISVVFNVGIIQYRVTIKHCQTGFGELPVKASYNNCDHKYGGREMHRERLKSAFLLKLEQSRC